MCKQMAGGELDVDRAVATFARIEVNDLPEVERPAVDCPNPAGRIVVAFANGGRLRIDGSKFFFHIGLIGLAKARHPCRHTSRLFPR
ncbi:hypothetical protein RFM26_29100 [Mesorhizobium sp. VK23B]|uniref:Uncharacterized protein n=1 Tax=Mesorhizobium dulcispinae TaxID=3072316 RepID=A0ABU4XRA6_9HYPH|nr:MULTISPECIES: hypothetical protein [unclassified Mesorhizobium]MDX8469755.1 hypothetical protein [Mesorhizobium sp. VK23B]MDX8476094.1 hypothetical protein [Mesorhizobium sp. VK23A]